MIKVGDPYSWIRVSENEKEYLIKIIHIIDLNKKITGFNRIEVSLIFNESSQKFTLTYYNVSAIYLFYNSKGFNVLDIYEEPLKKSLGWY